MKKIIAMIMVVIMLSSMSVLTFASTSGVDTFGKALKELGILNGDESGNLNEDNQLTRGELMVILDKLNSDPKDVFVAPDVPSFKDVPKTHWAYKFVERAKADGITSGIGNGLFGINDKVTYKQAASFLLRTLGYEHDWEFVTDSVKEVGLPYYGTEDVYFTRGLMFEMMAHSLTTYVAGVEYKLYDRLVHQGIVAKTHDVLKLLEQVRNGGIEEPDDYGTYLDESKYSFDSKLPKITTEIQDYLGTSLIKDYAKELDGLKFTKTTYSELYRLLDGASPYSDPALSFEVQYDIEDYLDSYYEMHNIFLSESGLKSVDNLVNSDGSMGIEFWDFNEVYKSESRYSEKSEINLTNYIVEGTRTEIRYGGDRITPVKLVFSVNDNGYVYHGIIFGEGLGAILY